MKMRYIKDESWRQIENMKKFQFIFFMYINIYYYLPTPPLGQDMTQGQFLSGV